MLTLGLGGLESYFGHLQEITKLKEELAQIENYEEYNYGSSSFSKTGTQKLEDINEETVTTLRNDDINELTLKALGNEETITTVNLSELTEKSNFYSANEKEKLTEIEVSQDKNSSLPVLDILIDTEQTSKPERDYLPTEMITSLENPSDLASNKTTEESTSFHPSSTGLSAEAALVKEAGIPEFLVEKANHQPLAEFITDSPLQRTQGMLHTEVHSSDKAVDFSNFSSDEIEAVQALPLIGAKKELVVGKHSTT